MTMYDLDKKVIVNVFVSLALFALVGLVAYTLYQDHKKIALLDQLIAGDHVKTNQIWTALTTQSNPQK